MTGPHDDLFDRLHAAADAVPASTLDLPVVLVTSRRKATARRAVAGTAVLTAFAVLGVGVASGVPGQVAHELVPAASGDTLSTEIVHREIAPGITAVAEAAAYELPDETVVLDTGIETGAHGDRFLIVSTVEFSAGGPFEDGTVTIDPGTGQVLDVAAGEGTEPSQDPEDPAYIQQMADLGYAPLETQRLQVVAGDEAELRRLRSGADPTTVVVSTLGPAAVVDTEGGRFVFGATLSENTGDDPGAFVSSWDSFTRDDGATGTFLIVPTLPIPQRAQAPFALVLTPETSFAPMMSAGFTDDYSATGPCTDRVDGCAVSYDAQSRVAVESQVEDPRWGALLETLPDEDLVVMDPVSKRELYRCRAGVRGAEAMFRADLTSEQEDRIIGATAEKAQCKVERSPTGDGSLRVGS